MAQNRRNGGSAGSSGDRRRGRAQGGGQSKGRRERQGRDDFNTRAERGSAGARRDAAGDGGKRTRSADRMTEGGRHDHRSASDGQLRKGSAARGSRGSGVQGHAFGAAGARDTWPASGSNRAAAHQGLYIEGRRAVAEALRTGFPHRRALIAAGQSDPGSEEFISALSEIGTPIEYVSRERLSELSSHGAHQGIMLEVGSFPYADITDIISAAGSGPALVVVLDHVTDEGNLGAIVRSAEVVGAAGVVIANKRAAGVGIGTFKTSAGAVMHLPIAQVANLASALEQLKEAGFWAVGASEHAEGTSWETPLDGRVALVMGAEGTGLSRLVQERCDMLTRLPQRGQTESLNVAQAATVLCYEWLRRSWDSLPPVPEV